MTLTTAFFCEHTPKRREIQHKGTLQIHSNPGAAIIYRGGKPVAHFPDIHGVVTDGHKIYVVQGSAPQRVLIIFRRVRIDGAHNLYMESSAYETKENWCGGIKKCFAVAYMEF